MSFYGSNVLVLLLLLAQEEPRAHRIAKQPAEHYDANEEESPVWQTLGWYASESLNKPVLVKPSVVLSFS